MRKRSAASTVVLSAALVISGCVDKNVGDVGQKNIKPYYATNDYEKNGVRINGEHTYGNPSYRTRFASDQSNERNRWFGRDGLGNNIVGTHDNYRLEMNDRIASELRKFTEVDSAYVITSDNSAYVGIVRRGNGASQTNAADLDPRLKDKIADRVKSMSVTSQNVYVTSHPDFIARMYSYSQAIARGEPVQRFLTEFNAMVARIFPAASVSPGSTSGTPGNGTDLSSDTGTDTGTERGSALTGRYK